MSPLRGYQEMMGTPESASSYSPTSSVLPSQVVPSTLVALSKSPTYPAGHKPIPWPDHVEKPTHKWFDQRVHSIVRGLVFQPPTKPIQATVAVKALPLELWHKVIDYLTLDLLPHQVGQWQAYALVCRDWRPRCEDNFFQSFRKGLEFHDIRMVCRIMRLLKARKDIRESIQDVVFRAPDAFWQFAVTMPCHFTRVQSLVINPVQPTLQSRRYLAGASIGRPPKENRLILDPALLPRPYIDTYRYLTIFTSVTYLSLIQVTIPSLLVFGRLVCALPSLIHLKCKSLHFISHGFERRLLLIPPNSTARLEIDHTCYDIVDFFTSTTLGRALNHLTIVRPQAPYGDFWNILQSAAPSLAAFDLHLDVRDRNDWGTLENELNFQHNAVLEVVVLRLSLNEDGNLNLGSLYTFLSTIPDGARLSEVSLILDRRHGDIIDALPSSPTLDNELCERIDELLAGPRYPCFKRFHIEIDDDFFPDGAASLLGRKEQEYWFKQISFLFSRLDGGGRLSTLLKIPPAHDRIKRTMIVPRPMESMDRQ
ncbi:uncharacterized protein FIBRA_09104 [Fibroporia radiculosa]|uniref:F-box domain-containing protein n=1 Tax=Fibroporia radiculosa TaxID=599839 RepID=J4H5I6_9APHY|nr:uncharacterized protein FIBRA_09104 [Fibroporia radiculosa]CCM06804.1 predicted protein [Fibroporia radiculosa]